MRGKNPLLHGVWLLALTSPPALGIDPATLANNGKAREPGPGRERGPYPPPP